MDKGQSPRVYGLKEGVRIFRSGDEIRLRKGVWSYVEVTVRLAGQSERTTRFFGAVYEALVQGQVADVDEIADRVGADSNERASYCDLLENLQRQQFLHNTRQQDVAKVVSSLLGGVLSGFEDYAGTLRPVLLFSDSPYIQEAAQTLARTINLPLDIMDETTFQALARADLTTRIDAVQHVETQQALSKVLLPYSCVLGCVSAPNLSMLRNLNRLLIAAEQPLILGLIDGPFLSLLSTHVTQTGCFECYEQRMLARLEDTVVYHRFAEATAGSFSPARGCFTPSLHMLMSAVISEGYLYSALGMLRLAGRIVNIYLPLLEIQVQDLLRVPYCPACGFISKAEMNEMYTSSKRLVTEMLSKVELEN